MLASEREGLIFGGLWEPVAEDLAPCHEDVDVLFDMSLSALGTDVSGRKRHQSVIPSINLDSEAAP
jgi:hypothetical protein